MKEKFSGWHLLFVQYFKRDWKQIIIWVLGIGLFSSAFVPAFQEISKGQGLTGMFETLKNPAMISMVGQTSVDNAEDYTLGAMYAHEMLLFCGLLSIIVSILHTVSHTRKEEDKGLIEIVRSFQVGRQANALATILEVILINILLALLISGIMVSYGAESMTVAGSILFGSSVGTAGILGGSIGLLMSQLMPNAASATGSSLGFVGLMYIIRAGTDINNESLSMWNPVGWTYLTYPFTDNNWQPIIFALLFSIIMMITSFILEEHRDLGAGYLPEKEGRARARKSLLSVKGLFFRLNRGVILAWMISFAVMGAAYGSIYVSMESFIESNDLLQGMFSASGFTIEESFTATIMMVLITMVGILPIAIINKLFKEERRSHLSQFYVTTVTRAKLYWSNIFLAVLTGMLGIFIAAGSLGLTAVAVMEGKSDMKFFEFLIAGFNFLPAVLFYTGLSGLILGAIPKMGKFVYIYLIISFLINYFGSILDMPDWIFKIAIQSWLPEMPTEDFNPLVFFTIIVISFILIILGFFIYKQRDFKEGS